MSSIKTPKDQPVEFGVQRVEDKLREKMASSKLLLFIVVLGLIIFFGLFIHGAEKQGEILSVIKEPTVPPVVRQDVARPEFGTYDPADPPEKPPANSVSIAENTTTRPSYEEYTSDIQVENDLNTVTGENQVQNLVLSPDDPQSNKTDKSARASFNSKYREGLTDAPALANGGEGLISNIPENSNLIAQLPSNPQSDILSGLLQQQLGAGGLPSIPIQPPQSILEYDLQNAQDSKEKFLKQPITGNVYNSSLPISAPTPFLMRAGTQIPIMLLQGVNSDLPGFLMAVVQYNIYDSVQDLVLLIPKGSRVILEYDSNVRFGQERLQLVAKRIILPNYQSVEIEQGAIFDTYGRVGLGEPDIEIDNHYDDVLKGGAIAGVLNYATGAAAAAEDSDALNALADGLTNTAQDITEIYAERTFNKQPTLTAKAGTTANIILLKDLILIPFKQTKQKDL